MNKQEQQEFFIKEIKPYVDLKVKEVFDFTKQYVDEYRKQIIEEEGHNRFDEFSETNKASVSALGLFLISLEDYLTNNSNITNKESEKQ